MNARVEKKISKIIGVDIRLVYSNYEFIDDNIEEITELIKRDIPSTIINTLINEEMIRQVQIAPCEGEYANALIEKNEIFLYGCHDWIMLIRGDKKRLEICKFI